MPAAHLAGAIEYPSLFCRKPAGVLDRDSAPLLHDAPSARSRGGAAVEDVGDEHAAVKPAGAAQAGELGTVRTFRDAEERERRGRRRGDRGRERQVTGELTNTDMRTS